MDRLKLGKTNAWLGAGGLVMLLSLALGCSTTPGGGVVFFPQGQRLSDSADLIRRSTPAKQVIARETQKSVLEVYVIEPGDVLALEPEEFLDEPLPIPRDQTVAIDGTVDLGPFGRPVVAGMSLDMAEEVVQRAIVEGLKQEQESDDDAEPEAAYQLRLVSAQSKVVYVLGEVNAPNAYPIQGRETVLDGLMLAGGLSQRADCEAIILSRPTEPCGCRVVLPVCYEQIVQLGDSTTNYQLRPGDRIFVPSRSIWKEMNPCRRREVSPGCSCSQTGCPPGELLNCVPGGMCGTPACATPTVMDVAPAIEPTPMPLPAEPTMP